MLKRIVLISIGCSRSVLKFVPLGLACQRTENKGFHQQTVLSNAIQITKQNRASKQTLPKMF